MLAKGIACFVILRIIIVQTLGDEAVDDIRFHGDEAIHDQKASSGLEFSEEILKKDFMGVADMMEAAPVSVDGGLDYDDEVGNNPDEMTDDEFYDYYGLDYGEEEEGDLLSDLDPELLQTISPTLIVGYFESASPEDLKAILDNSELLLKLPPETIGLIVQKLPNELIIQIVNSEGVKNLFINISSTTDPLRLEELKKFQTEVASVLFEKLDIEVIASLPEFLLKSQLENEKLLASLLSFPEKLLSIARAFPQLLSSIPPSVIVSLLQNNPTALENIPPEIISQVLHQTPASVLSSLVTQVLPLVPASLLSSALGNIPPGVISQVPPEVIASIIPMVPDEILLQLSSNSDLLITLDQNVIETLIDSVSTHQIKLLLAHGFLAEPSILTKIPLTAVTKFAGNLELVSLISDKTLTQLAELFPDLLTSIPATSAAHIVRNRPWIIGMMPLSVVTRLSNRQIEDLLGLLSDQDLVNLLTFQPALLNVAAKFPQNLLVRILHSRKSILDTIPPAAEPYISQLLIDETFIRKLPASLLASLAASEGIENLLTKYAIVSILRVHPSLPSLVPTEQIRPFIHFVTDPWFRMNIPCLTISLMSNNPKLVEIVPAAAMEKIISSRRILSCVPTTNLEKLMDHRLRLSRLSMVSMLRSARQLPREKYSMSLIMNFLKQQGPELGSALVNGELRWGRK